jgi:hypothetical protein
MGSFSRSADRGKLQMYSRLASRQIDMLQNLCEQQKINNMERLEQSVTMTPTTPFEAALDVIDRLPPDDQETTIEIVRKRLTDRRRREIADNAPATLQAFRVGRASYGTVDDLRREMEA